VRIHVHIVVTDANGRNADVLLTDDSHRLLGRLIPELVAMAAGEAAGIAISALSAHEDVGPIHRDRSGGDG
jgi:hypothetical protein